MEQNQKKTLEQARETATVKSAGRICRPEAADTAAPASRITRPGTATAAPMATAPVTVPMMAVSPVAIANSDQRPGGFGLVAMPAEPPQSAIVGAIVKFTKTGFFSNRGTTPVPIGTEVIARAVTEQWCCFAGAGGGLAKPPHTRSDGKPFPIRAELGDLDPSKWPLGLDGKPADPWSKQLYLLLFDPATAEDYTFVSGSFGGMKAIRQLCRQIAYRREISGISDLLARVQLAVTRWNSKKYGMILAPDFPIVGWVTGDLRPAPELKLATELDDSVT